MADLTDSQFTLGEGEDQVTFEVRKLLAMEAYECWEIIRTGLEAVFERVDGEAVRTAVETVKEVRARGASVATLVSNIAMFQIIGRALSAVPRETVEEVRLRLFPMVSFASRKQPPQPLAGNEAGAFEHLSGASVYTVLVRAAVVNFHESLDEFGSLMEGLPSSPSPEASTSPTSSTTPSRPG